ncbi:hypothetical protein F4677DRAFT_431510 [Hypoxylon crocopeplum]|nr:hypothetical protein F4677DRAFT_431510 [Hypoxylon crocopeplum]
MCWAAGRETTRAEDMAYCLLGIFGVNMPLLYGEGQEAFRRIQEEIIRKTPDYSIFAWASLNNTIGSKRGPKRLFSGVLASSAKQFYNCRGYTILTTSSNRVDESSVTNQGIKIQARLRLKHDPRKKGTPYLLPVCYQGKDRSLGIRLRKCGPNQFVRDSPSILDWIDQGYIWDSTAEDKYLLAQLPSSPSEGTERLTNQMIVQQSRGRVLQLHLPTALTISFAHPSSRFDDEDMVFFLPKREDRGCDGVSATLNGRLKLTVNRKCVEVSFLCFFYAFGWDQASSGEPSDVPQYTILNYRRHDAALNHISSQLVKHDQNSLEVLDNLQYYKIPKCPTAVFRFPKSKVNVVVSVTMERRKDTNICSEEFWRARFSWKKYDQNEIPPSRPESWDAARYGWDETSESAE